MGWCTAGEKIVGARSGSGTNLFVTAEEQERARVEALGLDEHTTRVVAALVGQLRAELDRTWRGRLDRAIARQHELRAERDRAEALVAKAEEVATARCYLPPKRRVPRFVMSGREVLRAIGALERYTGG